MTAPAVVVPAYTNPRGLYPFQADHLADALANRDTKPGRMFAWDTGLGKSHAALCAAALTLEDLAADVVVLVCEKVKLDEWVADFEQFTNLVVGKHHGPSRWKRLDKGWPQVLITTYETARADLTAFQKVKGRRGQHATDGPLTGRLKTSGLVPMFVLDEVDRLSNRSSGIYKSFEHALREFRRRGTTIVYGLTATPIRRDLEGAFNQLRLIAPNSMPLVGEFEKYFVTYRDQWDRPLYHPERINDFAEIAAPVLLAKSKEDPDVREQFPQMTEEALWVDLTPGQQDLYNLIFNMEGSEEDGSVLTALRQICAHPASLLHSAEHGTSKLAKMIAQEVGADALHGLGSAKTDRLVSYLRPIVLGQGAKAVVFSFFGPSVLPLLEQALKAAGMNVWMHDVPAAITAFQQSLEPGVLLCSDAAARGINLPQASYLVEYDLATTYGLRTQRINRISRIGQGGPSATVRSMLARRTVEVPLMHSMLKGNAQHDVLLGRETGGAYMTASMRRALLKQGM